MGVFSLVHGPWLPVRFADGVVKRIAPFEITADHDTNPVIDFAWPRPDFDLAAHELLIGLLAAVCPTDRQNRWADFFQKPPPPDALESAFAPFADAFVLDGDGPRFLQDFDALDGEETPVDALFIDAPGANTVKLNKDLFVKRGQVRVLSRAAAAMALYTLQQFAPSGGAGHRTSLRGGGPLVTLALPDSGSGPPATLWQRLWLNTPDDLRVPPADKVRAFPWLAPTRTSAQKEVVHDSDPGVNKLQAFFGMPRRIRLVFKENIDRLPCDLTGEIDEIICTGFVTTPWGVNYGTWRHPASPYYLPKAKGDEPPLPVHAPEGRLGYRNWLGLVKGEYRAKTINLAEKRLENLGVPWEEHSRLLTGGYAMDNAKALAFAEAEMPLHDLDPIYRTKIETFARLMVDGSSEAAKILGLSVKRALYGEKAEVKFDATPLDNARERLWELTEDGFHKSLDYGLAWLRADDGTNVQDRLAQSWRRTLEHVSLAIFDDTAPIDSFEELASEDVVEGRRLLFRSLKGYGKLGADLFKALGSLELPEVKKKPAASKGKRKEDA